MIYHLSTPLPPYGEARRREGSVCVDAIIHLFPTSDLNYSSSPRLGDCFSAINVFCCGFTACGSTI